MRMHRPRPRPMQAQAQAQTQAQAQAKAHAYVDTMHTCTPAYAQVKKDVKAKEVAVAANTLPPKVWDEARLRAWMAEAVSGRGEPLAPALGHLPAGVTGKGIMRLSAVQIKQHWGVTAELATAIFHELRGNQPGTRTLGALPGALPGPLLQAPLHLLSAERPVLASL